MAQRLLDRLLRKWRFRKSVVSCSALSVPISLWEFYSSCLKLPSLSKKGETIAVFKPTLKEAVGAVTLYKVENSVVVFLATSSDFENHGMGSFLLRLLYQSVRSRLYISCSDDISMYLLANECNNPTAWAWNGKRDFSVVEGTPSFPQTLKDSFSGEGDESPLKNYLIDTAGLTWLQKSVAAGDFFQNIMTGRTKQRLFSNLDWFACPSVNATLPGNLTLHQVNNCAPNVGTVSSRSLWDDVFTVDNDPGTSGTPDL